MKVCLGDGEGKSQHEKTKKKKISPEAFKSLASEVFKNRTDILPAVPLTVENYALTKCKSGM